MLQTNFKNINALVIRKAILVDFIIISNQDDSTLV